MHAGGKEVIDHEPQVTPLPSRDVPPVSTSRQQTSGLAAGLGAFVLWGFLPLYFRAIGPQVSVWEVVAHRVIWAAALLGLFALLTGRLGRVRAAFTDWRMLLALAASAVCIAVNWLTFIWAVNHNQVLESSLGYYITPLFNVLMGMAFLGERMRPLQYVAVGIATAGVILMIAAYGQVPWVALTLAGAFATYGLIRKQVPVDSATGLQVETLLLAPAALALVGWLALHHQSAFFRGGPGLDLLLIGSGAVTVVPLVLFATGARRLRLATIGLLQYITPTGHFLTGVFLFGEPFTAADGITFACIWTGLAIYTADTLVAQRKLRRVYGDS
ncbi:MAG: EamA family transporter RarD [Gammaproteobacteria bacterium]